MGLILRFDSADAKTSFLKRLGDASPVLRKKARPSKSDPAVVTVACSSAAEGGLVRDLLETGSKVFEDVRMRTF